MNLNGLLEAKGIKRRDFIKLMSATAAALGISQAYVPKMAEAVGEAVKKPPVIWLHGQECTGCSESTISSLNPGAAEVVLDLLSMRYHETIMAASGDVAEHALEETIAAGGYFLVVEGSIPTEDDRFCMVGGKPFRETLQKAAKNAVAVVAAGACACYGGIPAAGPTGAVGVWDIVDKSKVINVPSCPTKPSRLLGTIIHYLLFNKVPALDAYNRPVVFYGLLQHDNCPRRGHFEKGEFLKDWNDPQQKMYCLLLKGCKGPKTYTDCMHVWWNDGVNYCINAGSPCSGCTEPEFYKGFSPLYAKQEIFSMPTLGEVNADTAGKVVAGAAAVGAFAHLVGSAVSGRLGDKEGHGGKGVKG